MSSPDDLLRTNQERIEWVLDHPHFSPWLKQALHAARDGDPLDVLSELDVLVFLLRTECEARLCVERDAAEAKVAGRRSD